MDLEERLATLSKASDEEDLGPITQGAQASDSTIRGIEDVLCRRLPGDYIRFLKRYGAIGIGDINFFGTWSDSVDDLRGATVLGETLRLRKEFSLPQDLVAVFGSDYESYLCLNCSAIEGLPKMVYFSATQKSVFACEHSNSFEEFVMKYIDALLGKRWVPKAQLKQASLLQRIMTKFK
ncbi:MAG TPA: SMI1/KNR4 family protein [Oligoflexus sp.]|uniref:SMI1/KNR4 family protein n=1 Tax=Oligoflexus sp. TaxID=1971216 RepID=UPI002D30BF6A|nr:SMI1/KNR4 family protein [Oligoflexus sp.]HYX35274.1 SMI1/KNR4 family protein [Oligoflexus sp.]